MFSPEIEAALEATLVVANELLGDELLTAVLFGDLAGGYFQVGESTVDLLLLTKGEPPWQELREAYRPVWQQHGPHLRRAPLVASQASWQRYAFLKPHFVYQVENTGQILQGTLSVTGVVNDQLLAYGELCCRARDASASLAPGLLHPEARANAQQNLRGLARQLGSAPLNAQSDVALLALVQTRLNLMADALGLAEPDLPEQPDAPPPLPALLAIYEKVDQLMLIMPDLDADTLTSIDWPEVAERVAADYGSLHLCTPRQLQAALQYYSPISLKLRHYDHAWGIDFLADLPVEMRLVFLEAARTPAQIQLEALPSAYLAATDEELGKLVHDFQNRLLNVQLQHELFQRLLKIDRALPDQPLLRREYTFPERVASTMYHLNWWADHYLSLATQAAQNESP